MSIVRFDPFRDLDRLASEMFRMPVGGDAGPAVDLEQHGQDTYVVRVAVPGFTRDDLEINLHDRVLTVKGTREARTDENVRVMYRGIAGGGFERTFNLGRHIEIAGADLADGILEIKLERRVPEALKPRSIAIGERGAKASTAAQVEDKETVAA